MLLVVNRVVLLFVFLLFPIIGFSKGTNIIVIGQSISSNCNQTRFVAVPGVYQLNLDGEKVFAQDPFVWADCDGGSIWMPFAERLIASGFTDEVTLMPIGVAGTKLIDWLPDGKANKKLKRALSAARENGIKFDYVFFYLGSSDIGESPKKYKSQLIELNRFVREEIGYSSWLVAQHSRCNDGYDSTIAKVQRSFNKIPFYAGPDSNSLGDEYRVDGCHLNKAGQEKMAALWVESLIQAADKKQRIEKETLLHLFK